MKNKSNKNHFDQPGQITRRMLEISERILLLTKTGNYSKEFYDLNDEMILLNGMLMERLEGSVPPCSTCSFRKVCPFTDNQATKNHYLYCPKTGQGQHSKYKTLFVNDVKLRKLLRVQLN